jgi:hypothetical protein
VAVISGITAYLDQPSWAGVAAVIGFAVVASLRLYSATSELESKWYSGRAAAESVKTLVWRYAVGGDPFAKTEPEADRQYVNATLEVIKFLDLPLATGVGSDPSITEWMRASRAGDLESRRAIYEEGRIADQERWYASRGATNQVSAGRWLGIALGIELVGCLLALLMAIGVLAFDAIPIIAAAAAAATGWTESRQFRSLASAYGVAEQELANVKALIDSATTELAWARFVEEAEEAISREHTLWLASRGQRPRGPASRSLANPSS